MAIGSEVRQMAEKDGTVWFFRYHELKEGAKHNAYLNYCALVRPIQFSHFEAQEAGKHIYLKDGTYADQTHTGAEILARR